MTLVSLLIRCLYLMVMNLVNTEPILRSISCLALTANARFLLGLDKFRHAFLISNSEC